MIVSSTRTHAHSPQNVSRETELRLAQYSDLVATWNQKINLVSPSTLAQFRQRHVEDSIQVLDAVMPAAGRWVDLGSGAGLPGLPVAIMADTLAPNLDIILVESDKRKAAFLREAVRTLSLHVQVMCQRAEKLPPLHADYISARALAPLDRLCELAAPHLSERGICIFPKGRDADREIAEARRKWTFHCRKVPSRTDGEASILIMSELQRAA